MQERELQKKLKKYFDEQKKTRHITQVTLAYVIGISEFQVWELLKLGRIRTHATRNLIVDFLESK